MHFFRGHFWWLLPVTSYYLLIWESIKIIFSLEFFLYHKYRCFEGKLEYQGFIFYFVPTLHLTQDNFLASFSWWAHFLSLSFHGWMYAFNVLVYRETTDPFYTMCISKFCFVSLNGFQTHAFWLLLSAINFHYFCSIAPVSFPFWFSRYSFTFLLAQLHNLKDNFTFFT